jgi:hypothetical protein
MSDRQALIITLAWILGAAWVLIPHPFEGSVLWIVSERPDLGIHRNDPLGVFVPLAVTAMVVGWRRDR